MRDTQLGWRGEEPGLGEATDGLTAEGVNMGIVDDAALAAGGFAFDLSVASRTPAGIMATVLAHHGRVGLSEGQLRALLDIDARYRKRRLDLALEFARLRAHGEVGTDRLDDVTLAAKREVVRRQAEIFVEHQMSYLEFTAEAQALLDDEQLDRARELLMEERSAAFEVLGPLTTRAIVEAASERRTQGSASRVVVP